MRKMRFELFIEFRVDDIKEKETCCINAMKLCHQMNRKDVQCFMIDYPMKYKRCNDTIIRSILENVTCSVPNEKSAYNILKRLNELYDYKYCAEVRDCCGYKNACNQDNIEWFNM